MITTDPCDIPAADWVRAEDRRKAAFYDKLMADIKAGQWQIVPVQNGKLVIDLNKTVYGSHAPAKYPGLPE